MDACNFIVGRVPVGDHLAMRAEWFIREHQRWMAILEKNRLQFARFEPFPILSIVEYLAHFGRADTSNCYRIMRHAFSD